MKTAHRSEPYSCTENKERKVWIWRLKLFQFPLSWESIEIQPSLISHSFCDVVLLFSFAEKSSIIDNTKIYKGIDILTRKFFWWEGLFVLKIVCTFLEAHIVPGLLALISRIHEKRLLLSFGKLTCGCLFLNKSWWESVWICHKMGEENVVVILNGGIRSTDYIRLGVYFKMRKLQIGNR